VESPLEVGDWVRSYGAGIWRIYRILECQNELSEPGDESVRQTVFVKRFVSNSFKRSFSEDSCSPFFVRRLDPEEQRALEDFIATNPKVYERFLAYEPKPVDAIYNASISIPADRNAERVRQALVDLNLLSASEIVGELKRLGLSPATLPSWTAQFVSPKHELRQGHLLYSFCAVFEF